MLTPYLLCKTDKTHPLMMDEASNCRCGFKLSSLGNTHDPPKLLKQVVKIRKTGKLHVNYQGKSISKMLILSTYHVA